MPVRRLLPLLSLLPILAFPARAGAEIGAADIPGDAEWYLHADLKAMRGADSGSVLYGWLNDEVFAEVQNEIGIDLNEEVDSVTAFADGTLGTVIVVDGPISKDTRDKLLALAAVKARLDTLTYDGKTYYHARERKESAPRRRSLEDFDESAWFTFDVDDKLIVTSDQQQLEALLDSGGRLAGAGGHAGALFVLTADKEFVQAGARTSELAGEDDDWDSNILRNTEKAALLVSDSKGLLAVQAQLVSRDPTITQSLGGIINGLISLQAFNEDLDPELLAMIQNTRIEILDNVLSINTIFDPDVVVGLLENQ